MDLSIIMPLYNTKKYMLPMLASLQYQDVGNYEVEYIFVCNGCTDGTYEALDAIINQYRDEFKNVSLYSSPTPGVAAARNFGLEQATGNYIWMIDSDDYLMTDTVIKDTLDVCYQNMGAGYVRFDFDTPKEDYIYKVGDGQVGSILYNKIIKSMGCVLWRYFFRADIAKAIKFKDRGLGGIEEDLVYIDDFTNICRQNNIPCFNFNKKQYYYLLMRKGSSMYNYYGQLPRFTKEEFLEFAKGRENDFKDILENML